MAPWRSRKESPGTTGSTGSPRVALPFAGRFFVLVTLTLAGCVSDPQGTPDGGPDGGHPSSDGGVALSDGGVRDAGSSDGGGVIAQVYSVQALTSNGTPAAPNTDNTLVNAWGLAAGTTSPLWVASKAADVVRPYDATGTPVAAPVDMPGSSGPPVGIVYNGENSFDRDTVILATGTGQIIGWQSGTGSVVRVDNAGSEACYAGLALARTSMGDRIYATNFHAGVVEIYNGDYSAGGTFTDPGMPAGFAPFNVVVIQQQLYVTFARQDGAKKAALPGNGTGAVDVFDLSGKLVRALVSGGELNAPYGVVYSPIDFGRFSELLLVGNSGNGRINAFDPVRGDFLGALQLPGYQPIVISGLHSLLFGNDTSVGTHDTLFFTAGPNDGANGELGSITESF